MRERIAFYADHHKGGNPFGRDAITWMLKGLEVQLNLIEAQETLIKEQQINSFAKDVEISELRGELAGNRP